VRESNTPVTFILMY